MKTFKQFTNERVVDILKPKDEDKIKAALDSLDTDYDRVRTIYKYKIPKSYLPTNTKDVLIDKIKEKVLTTDINMNTKYNIALKEKNIKGVSVNGIIIKNGVFNKTIPFRKLDMDLLLLIVQQLDPYYHFELPTNMIVSGNLNLYANVLTELPDNLILSGEIIQPNSNESVRNILKPKSEEDLKKAKEVATRTIKELINNLSNNDWVFFPHYHHIMIDSPKGQIQYIVGATSNHVKVQVFNNNMILKNVYELTYDKVDPKKLITIIFILKSLLREKRLTNEGVSDYLSPKSEDNIRKELDKLSDTERIILIQKEGYPEKYLPKNYEKIVTNTINHIKKIVKEKQHNGYIYVDDLDPYEYPIIVNDNIPYFENHEIIRLYNNKIEVYVTTMSKTNQYSYHIPYDKLDFETLVDIKKLLDDVVEWDTIERNRATQESVMKSFSQFINENVTDILKGKPEEDVINSLKYLDHDEQIIAIYKYNLPKSLLPKNYENMKNGLIRDIKDDLKETLKLENGGFNYPLGLWKDLKIDYDTKLIYIPKEYDKYNDNYEHYIEFIYQDGVGIQVWIDGNQYNEYFVKYDKMEYPDLKNIYYHLENYLNSL